MPDYTKLIPMDALRGENAEETLRLRGLVAEARQYLESFPWCRGVKKAYLGFGIGGVVGVCLFEIESDESDPVLWVISGDLPCAYLVTDDARTPRDALQVYCRLMGEWVDAVRKGGSLDDVFPVEAEASLANADQLEKRIAFLEAEVIPLVD